jgi:hypothetical protein
VFVAPLAVYYGVTLTAKPVAGSVVTFGIVAVTTVEPTPSGSN